MPSYVSRKVDGKWVTVVVEDEPKKEPVEEKAVEEDAITCPKGLLKPLAKPVVCRENECGCFTRADEDKPQSCSWKGWSGSESETVIQPPEEEVIEPVQEKKPEEVVTCPENLPWPPTIFNKCREWGCEFFKRSYGERPAACRWVPPVPEVEAEEAAEADEKPDSPEIVLTYGERLKRLREHEALRNKYLTKEILTGFMKKVMELSAAEKFELDSKKKIDGVEPDQWLVNELSEELDAFIIEPSSRALVSMALRACILDYRLQRRR